MGTYSRFDPGCCCECIVYTDTFDRADGPLGSDWVASGTASISSNTAKIESGNIKYQKEVVDPGGTFVVTFETVNTLDGDIYDFFVFDDSGNVLMTARFQADGTSGFWIVSLRYQTGAWYSDNVELIAGCGTYQEAFLAGRGWVVSFDGQVFRVGGTTPERPHYELWKCYGAVGGTVAKVGFGHGGGPRDIYIDQFVLSDHYTHNTNCPNYGCLCGNGDAVCWADTLYLELTNPSGCYVQLPNPSTTITLNRVYRSQSLWASDKVLPCYGCTTETWFYNQFYLICQFSPGNPGFVLSMCTEYSDTTFECEECDPANPLPPPINVPWTLVDAVTDCGPFYLKFSLSDWYNVCSKAVDDCDFGWPTCDPLTAEITE